MRDTIATLFRANPTVARAAVAALLLAITCGLGGCAGGGAAGGSFAMAGGGSSVAFESIDGPPPHVFDRMVDVLDSESKLRNLSIVSREGSAAYRVRSYLAAQVSRGRTARPAARPAAQRRGTGRQGRTGPLGRRRRSGVAENRPGRIERPQRPDQWNGAGCAAGVGTGQAWPRGRKRGKARTRCRLVQRHGARL
jgi:hypothetical protein